MIYTYLKNQNCRCQPIMKSTKLFMLLLFVCHSFLPAEPVPEIKISRAANQFEISVHSSGGGLLHSPGEGLWAVAVGWEDGWPSGWVYSSPVEQKQSGAWTILKGRLSLPQGGWIISDSYRSRGTFIEGRRRWEWTGKEPLDQVTLAIRWVTPGTGKRIVMPGILYHGNPSGKRSGKTPVFDGGHGEKAFYEEHRFPMPFVSFEYEENGAFQGVALHSMPSPVTGGNRADQWWSLGAQSSGQGTELSLYSGPTATNGRNSTIKAMQNRFLPYDNTWIRIDPGEIIEKTFYLQGFSVQREGSGFQKAVAAALEIFPPAGVEQFSPFEEIIHDKYRFALTRWHEEGQAKGFRKYPDRPFFVLGWCGQAAAPGYALQVLGEKLADPRIPEIVQQSLDFLSGAQFYDQGFHTWYNYEEDRWLNEEILSQGQAMHNIARAILTGENNGMNTEKWKDFLEKASTLHSERILSEGWYPESTSEGFFIAPLCLASRIFDEPLYLRAAEFAGKHYAKRHLSMREPYWGGTLDAQCEDKEGAFAALQGFLELYETTGSEEYLKWAWHAGDVTLTYTVLWDIDLPAGRLRDHNFKTRGWTAVSPQNEHIDVYGVLIAPDIYRLGLHTGNQKLKDLALLMFRSCGQLIDSSGSQGEQPQHTNYTQFRKTNFIEQNGIESLRGDYNETWTVFWITAHFLNAAARFEELGVGIWN